MFYNTVPIDVADDLRAEAQHLLSSPSKLSPLLCRGGGWLDVHRGHGGGGGQFKIHRLCCEVVTIKCYCYVMCH